MNEKPMTLDEIEAEMLGCTTENSTEDAHVRADDLLGELIRTLVIGTPHEEQARLIWNTYCDVDKWYA